MANQVSIREGIYDSSLQSDMEREGPLKIPKNFADLRNINVSKTSVRKTSDYPVLNKRFINEYQQ